MTIHIALLDFLKLMKLFVATLKSFEVKMYSELIPAIF